MNDLNPIIHESARLVLVSSLYVVDEADFVYLTNRTSFTVPLTTPTGTYKLCAVVDADDSFAESSEADNVISSDADVTVLGRFSCL